MSKFKNQLNAIKQILKNKPLIYNVKFHESGTIKITKNRNILITEQSQNIIIDMEGLSLKLPDGYGGKL